MKRSISSSALQRMRKLSDAVLDFVQSTTAPKPDNTQDDASFDYGGRDRRHGKAQEPELLRTLSHRNISKVDIRPYSHIDPSDSTLNLYVGGGVMKDNGEPRVSIETELRSRFSVDSDVLFMASGRGRKADKKAPNERSAKKATKKAATAPQTKRPEVPLRPTGEDLLSDLLGVKNAQGLAPPPACAVREREEERRQRHLLARRSEESVHRRAIEQGLPRRGRSLREKALNPNPDDDEVGPPVPPKDHVPKMFSPFANTGRKVQPTGNPEPRPGEGAHLTRGASTKSAPAGTVGVSRIVPPVRRQGTSDDRKPERSVHAQAPKTTDALRRISSSSDLTLHAPTRSLHHVRSRAADVRNPRHVRPDEREPQRGQATPQKDPRSYKPEAPRLRQPTRTPPGPAPKAPLPPRPDAYLPGPRHKKRPSEMDIPRDVYPEDDQFSASRRSSEQPATRTAQRLRERDSQATLVSEATLVSPAPAPSPAMIAKLQAALRVKDVSSPRTVKATIVPPRAKERPVSSESEVVVIAPYMFEHDIPIPLKTLPASVTPLTWKSRERKHVESFGRGGPWSPKRDTYQKEQLAFAVMEPESVRPLAIRKSSGRMRVERRLNA